MKTAIFKVAIILMLAFVSASGRAEATTKKAYINMYVMIMDWTERAMLWVEKHREDAQLGRIALQVAETNIKIVQDYSPPKEFVEIHPHFIAIVENSANAFEAVASGSPSKFFKYKRNIRKEKKALLAVMRELNFVFPEII